MQSRYYNPEWGRFINEDDVKILELTREVRLGHNLFAYCLNNFVNNSDPSGYWPRWWRIRGFKSTWDGFGVNVNHRFLSKWFCLAFAARIRKYRHSFKYSYGINRMSTFRIAVEVYAYAVGYYYGRTANFISFRRFGNRWIDQGKYVNCNYNDKWARKYYAIWWATI